MIWKAVLSRLQGIIALPSLMKYNIDYFVLVTDVLRRIWHKLVNNLTEKVNISASIVAYSRYKFR